MRLIVFGSRTWSDPSIITADLEQAFSLGFRTLVHGACASGADYMADLAARPRFRVERFRGSADDMAALGADLAIGYRLAGESRGTDDMARACARHGIPIVRRGWGWP